MEVVWLISAIVAVLVYRKDKNIFRFDKSYYFHFLYIITIASATSLVLRYLLGAFPPVPELRFGYLLMVGWEDILFSLLPIYLARKYLSENAAMFTTLLASALFALGHKYQSDLWAFITLFYPFFFSYLIGRKHGYGTVIICHVTYDLIVHGTTWLLFILGAK